MLIYLSYPMSGQPDHGIPHAGKVAETLRLFYPDHEFVVPHEIMHSADGTQHANPDFSHGDYVREDIKKGLSTCQGIALVDGWPYSSGCRDEFQYAAMTGYRVFSVVTDKAFWITLRPMDGGDEL